MHLLIFPNFFGKKKIMTKIAEKKDVCFIWCLWLLCNFEQNFFFLSLKCMNFGSTAEMRFVFRPLSNDVISISIGESAICHCYLKCVFFSRSFTSERQIWFILGNVCTWRALLLRCHPGISPVFSFLFTCST